MYTEKTLYNGFILPLWIRRIAVFGMTSVTLISLVLSIMALYVYDKVICIPLIMATIQILSIWYFSFFFRRYYITENGIYLSDARFVFKLREYAWGEVKYIQRKFLWYDNYGKENAKEKVLCVLVFTDKSKDPKEFEGLIGFDDIKWTYMSCQKHILCLIDDEDIVNLLEQKTGLYCENKM